QMAAERPGQPSGRVAPLPGLVLEDRLAHAERARYVTRGPRLGQLVDGNVRVRGHERLDLALADRLAGSPGRDLVHLGLERTRVLADERDERRDRIGLGPPPALVEPFPDPL